MTGDHRHTTFTPEEHSEGRPRWNMPVSTPADLDHQLETDLAALGEGRTELGHPENPYDPTTQPADWAAFEYGKKVQPGATEQRVARARTILPAIEIPEAVEPQKED